MKYIYRAIFVSFLFSMTCLNAVVANAGDDCFLSHQTLRGINQIYLKIEVPWKYDGTGKCGKTDKQCQLDAETRPVNLLSPGKPDYYPKALTYESLRDVFVKLINERWLASDSCRKVGLIARDVNAPLEGFAVTDSPLVISVFIEVEEKTKPRIAVLRIHQHQKDFDKEGHEDIGGENLRAIPLDLSNGAVTTIISDIASRSIGGVVKLY